MNKESSASGGLGILGVVQIIFIVLKLLGVGTIATWSWATVLIPLWIELGIIAFIIIVVVIAAIISSKI